MPVIRSLIKQMLRAAGLEVKRLQEAAQPAAAGRPVGSMEHVLQDLSARGLKCETILDVGAHKAAWSVLARSVFPDARFLLIEPQWEMKSHLESFCRNAPGSDYVLAGAASERSTRKLTIWDDRAGSSFLPHENEQLAQEGRQRSVPVSTVDELLQEKRFACPALIKIDVQGYELEVLKGAASTFGRTEVYILEVSFFSFTDVPGMPQFFEVLQFMHDRGYVAYDFAGFLRRPSDGALGQCDVCFVKKDGFLRSSHAW